MVSATSSAHASLTHDELLTRKEQKRTAVDLGIHPVTLSKWLRQDDIDNGQRPGGLSEESAELRAARRRIRELETELEMVSAGS